MKKIVGVVGSVALSIAGTSLAVPGPSAPSQVRALAKAESNVLALLGKFQNTAAWKAQYRAAVAAQDAAIARVNADLFPVVARNTLSWTADKSFDTPSFIVNGTFTLSWTTSPDSGVNCNSGVYVLVLIFPQGSKVSAGNYSAGPFEQDNCRPFSTKVKGLSGSQFIDVSIAGAAVTVTASGAIAP